MKSEGKLEITDELLLYHDLTALPKNLMRLLQQRGQEALIYTIGDWLVDNSHMP